MTTDGTQPKRPDGPPGPPTHTHPDGVECAYDLTRGRWYVSERHVYGNREPLACPGWIEALMPEPQAEGGGA